MKKILIALALLLVPAPAVATVSCTLPITLTQGTTANATDVMADFNQLVSCLALAASAGANSDITSLSGLITPLAPGQGGTTIFLGGTSTGSANAQIVASTTPNTFTLTAGLIVSFIPGFANTGSMTLNVNSTGNVTVGRFQNVSLTGGEVQSGQAVMAYYNGSEFILLNTGPQFGGFGLGSVVVGGGTSDITASPGHFATIQGGAGPITNLGSAVSASTPVYMIFWQGTYTLQTGGNISVLPGGGSSFVVNTNDMSIVFNNGAGWFFLGHFKANGLAINSNTPLCGASGVVINNLVGTPNTQITYSASQATLVNPATNGVQYGINIAGTNNTGTGNVTSTADGMDGETPPAPGFIFIWLVGNGTAINSLASTSSTAPTMPAGFSFRCRVGAMRFDASPNLFRTKQIGQHVQYVVTAGSANTTTLPNAANGIAGTYSTTAPVWVAVSLSSHVPSTAAKANLVIDNNWKAAGISNVQVAPNNAYGGYASASGNPAPFDFVPAAANFMSASISLLLETQQFFWAASGAGGAVSVLGWEDSANVN